MRPISCSSSEFRLEGDYLLGGLFALHEIDTVTPVFNPETTECFRHSTSKSGYEMLQLMRFAVEEINNSTTLLPNVSLGYDIFDHCSNTRNFHSVLSFISKNGSIKPQQKLNYQPKVIALTGPYGSSRTISVAPLITMDLIPMVNYGASSYVLSDKLQYPSYVRTIPSNKDLIEMTIQILRWFGWNWVAFLSSQQDLDGLNLFNKYIRNTGICLAYQEGLSLNANYSQTLKKIDELKINVIVIFAWPQYADKIIKAAIANNIQDKVWIASQHWAMNKQLPSEPGIRKIGTIIGITENLLSLPGFNEFVYKAKGTTDVGHNDRAENEVQGKSKICNQVCDYCSLLTAEEIINENPTYSFAIYSAIYTIAHALHKVLQCDMNKCNKNTMVKPYMSPSTPELGWMPSFSVSSQRPLRNSNWSGPPPEGPTRSRLDEWYLPGRRQAPRQRSAPFFPEVHDELTKSWRAPYSAHLRTSSAALSSVDGSQEKGYEQLPPLDEAVASHLCPPAAVGWKNKRALPSKLCRTTSAMAGRAYTSAGQAASALHTMAILKVFQAKLLHSLDESSPSDPAFCDLRSATDLALRATKATAQVIGRSMANLVVLERHLWLNLTEIKESDKVAFLDAPVSPSSLFGPAVEGFTEHFTAAQKSSQAMRHFLPKRSTSALSRPRTAPTQHQSKPVPSTPQAAPPEEQHPARPTRRTKPPRRQGPRQRIVLDPMPSKSS
ncbi:taste receptor type 1 member 1-like [Carassius carassius]|uniref:taste receptor type 1 member 1-like n=1 Tax=Carassius carassius TaxID=217509 RepID=UPI00286866EC|nr:taste receptor type 1 member 1-like [Carassius carassius]